MIADLESLVLQCRHDRAKSYIFEAVNSYKAGAYRSAIVATWVAVVLDFMDKIYELAEEGDSRAVEQRESIEKFIGKTDIASIRLSEKFEHCLLDKAQELEFINEYQYKELERLKIDRNYCAHPASVEIEVPFQASPESARYHLRNAVEYLLSQPATQGKVALEKLELKVRGPHFPTDETRAASILRQGPLERPSQSLLRNFLKRCLKYAVLERETSRDECFRFIAAIQACCILHQSSCETVLNVELPKTLRLIEDDLSWRAILLLSRASATRAFVDESNQHALQSYLETIPDDAPNGIVASALRVEFLAEIANNILTNTSVDNLRDDYSEDFSPQLVSAIVTRYLNASSFNEANSIARKLLTDLVPTLSAEEAASIRSAYFKNDQISNSTSATGVLRVLVKTSALSDDKEGWSEFLTKMSATNRRYWERPIIELLSEKFPDIDVDSLFPEDDAQEVDEDEELPF